MWETDIVAFPVGSRIELGGKLTLPRITSEFDLAAPERRVRDGDGNIRVGRQGESGASMGVVWEEIDSRRERGFGR
jgi:hypothetical protein